MTGRLLSINVGLPRDVAWRGKIVHTAVWKAPVQGRRMVRRLNIDGDGQGDLTGHGGEHRAVLVYQMIRTDTGKPSSVAGTSPMDSSAKISRLTACPTRRFVSVIATGLARRCSK